MKLLKWSRATVSSTTSYTIREQQPRRQRRCGAIAVRDPIVPYLESNISIEVETTQQLRDHTLYLSGGVVREPVMEEVLNRIEGYAGASVVVCGKKNTGKSTTCRRLINGLLGKKHTSVAYGCRSVMANDIADAPQIPRV